MNTVTTISPKASTRQTILAIDDDPSSLDVLSQLLQPHYKVLAAPSGERALPIATRSPQPDLILLDVLMPDMDGYTVLARLRENPATRDIPVIFVTGLDSIDAEEKGLELGAVDYVTKPYRPAVILARIHTHLELKRIRDWLRNQNTYLETEVAGREATLHSVTTAARDAIVMIDSADRIAFWNPAAETMFGYAGAEVMGRELHGLLTPLRFREAAAQGLAGFRHTGKGGAVGKTLELVALRKDGAEFPIELSLSAIQREEGWWGVAIVRDLTERKALDDELAQAQRHLLQSEKMASIGQLAAGVAHELNNPIGFVNSNLGTLDGYLHDIFAIADAYAAVESATPACCPQLDKVLTLKREKDYDFLRNDIYQLMAESKDGLARVAKIVKDLKNFSRAGETAMQWADLHQGIDSTLNIVWNELKYKCTVTKDYGSLPQVWCEPSQINQVFMNLLVNAGHAIPDKGEIALRTGQQGEQVFVAITDTGAGIAPENLLRIFDPFFTTKPVGQGTGLGLSLSYSIMQKHHGRIEVQSTLGKGTTFTVWLPINPPDKTNAVPPEPTSEKS
jgi:PAS domain S-box-containing protein